MVVLELVVGQSSCSLVGSGEMLDDGYRFRTRTFGATAFGVLDSLAFLERIECVVLNSRVVEEQFTIVAFNESETLVRHQLLNYAL